ncbi:MULTISPECIES: ribokinase [Comamonas]|uniref:Ribokinase n=2 Tax=Comamonas TaxID=283 RepID=A0ABY5ZSX5_9BURK|nr:MULTISPECIES: ribokinase [Comamonas]UXC17067.1 ribokinase [Comamonas sp. PR12]
MNVPILSQAPRIVVLGSLNMDLVLRVPHMPRAGETMLGQSLSQVPGGKGGNQAVSCARQGAAVSLLSCVGEDAYADQLLAGLVADHIDVQHVQRSARDATGVAVISVDDSAQNQIVVVPGANLRLQVTEPVLRPLLQDAAYVVLQFETPLEEVDQALRSARAVGCKTVLNPSPVQPLPDAWWPAIDVLVVNEAEAAQLSGSPVDSPESAARAARWLQAKGAGQVVVTLGSQGAVCCDARSASTAEAPAHWHRAPQVQAVDTTAAGDTFLGALTVQLASGASLDEATQWAIRAAGICVTRAGAQPSIPFHAEVATRTEASPWSPV